MKLQILAEELLVELSPQEIYQKFYSGITDSLFYALVAIDPQTQIDESNGHIIRLGKYAKLIINLYQKGQFKREDSKKLKEYLEYVYKYRIPLDMNKVTSTGDIYNLVEKYVNADTQDLSNIFQTLKSGEDYKTLFNGHNWVIYQPLTEKGACYIGVQTEWCTTWGPMSLNKSHQDRSNRFAAYNTAANPLYIIVNKQDQTEKYQFHFSSSQFMDSGDRKIDLSSFFENNPEVRNFFYPSFIRTSSEKEREWEIDHLKLLSNEDVAVLASKILNIDEISNPIAIAILEKNREAISELIDDEQLSASPNIETSRASKSVISISFEFTSSNVFKGHDNLEGAESNLSYLHSDKAYSNDNVYREYQETDFNDTWWTDYMEGLLKDYYVEHSDDINMNFSIRTFEKFKLNFFDDFNENEDLRSNLINEFITQNQDVYDTALIEEINQTERFIKFDIHSSYVEITLHIIYFIQYLIKHNIQKIENNLFDILDDYVEYYDISTYYEGINDYGRITPQYSDSNVKNAMNEYFEKIIDNFEEFEECLEIKKKFNELYDKYFRDDKYENEHVLINLVDQSIDCEDGTIEISYYNKDKGKKYKGKIKVKNLPVYMSNYALFEQFHTMKKLI